MSETVEPPVEEAVVEQQEATETQEQQAAEQKPAEPEKKPKQGDRRFAHLTARANEAARRADQAEAEVRRLTELLAAGGKDGETKPESQATQAQIRAEAQRIVAEEALNRDRHRIIREGVALYGESEWEAKTSLLHTMGALARPEFMEALADLPDAHRVVAALADDPDELQDLLSKRPVAMAAAIGRLAMELSVKNQDQPKEISKTPAPVKPVTAGRVAPAPDLAKLAQTDPKAYIEFRNRTAPKHLGGRGQAA